jgi:prepilin-type N-terminal cleavage/methylation domain-containing protein
MNRFLSKKQQGFTVVELLISITIISMIFIALFTGFSHNLDAMRRGDDEMFLQGEVARLLTDLYMELTSINPCLIIDKENNLWVSGEKAKEIQPCTISFIDTDRNRQNGFEKLSFIQYAEANITDARKVNYYFKPHPDNIAKRQENADGSAYILMKDRGSRTITVSENVSDLRFFPENGHTRAVRITGEVAKKNAKGKIQKYPFSFMVRLESLYIAFREVVL